MLLDMKARYWSVALQNQK